MLVVLAVKKLLLHYQLFTKEKRHEVRDDILICHFTDAPKVWVYP